MILVTTFKNSRIFEYTNTETQPTKGRKIMKNYSKTTEETLITFHNSGGGGNRRKVEYCDQDMTIDTYTNYLYVMYENQGYIYRKIKNKENLEKLFDLATEDVGTKNEALQKFEKRTGLTFGEAYYCDCNNNSTGLALANDGTGTIDEDGDYNTTTVKKLEDCDEEDLLLIHNSNTYKSSDVEKYCYDKLLEANLIFEEDDENEA